MTTDTCDHCGKEKPCIVDKRAEVTICYECCGPGVKVDADNSKKLIDALRRVGRQKVEGEGG